MALVMALVKIGVGADLGGVELPVQDLREMRALTASCSCTAGLDEEGRCQGRAGERERGRERGKGEGGRVEREKEKRERERGGKSEIDQSSHGISRRIIPHISNVRN